MAEERPPVPSPLRRQPCLRLAARPAPPHLLEGTAPPWARGLPGESTLFHQLSQETSSLSVHHGVMDPSPMPEDPPGSHPRPQLRLALPWG